MAEGSEEDDDDYLSMTFDDHQKTGGAKETSLQRVARLKKEAAERAHIPSKAELAAKEKAARDAALATELDSANNKGAKMMAKMGFKGGALGQVDDARTKPIELLVKDDRGGIGMDSEKKRKVREAADAVEEGEKRRKVGMDEFRERNRLEREEKRAEGLVWGAMKVLEGFESEATMSTDVDEEGVVDESAKSNGKETKRLRDVNVLYRPLLKQRLERERERKMRYDLNNALSNRNDDADEDEHDIFDQRTEELDDEDLELEEFESLSFVERLERIVMELRAKYCYCFWCKFRYPDAEMDGCPGLTEDEHG